LPGAHSCMFAVQTSPSGKTVLLHPSRASSRSGADVLLKGKAG